MNELRPGHIARGAVQVLTARSDAGLHLRLHLAHRFIDGTAEGSHDALVTTQRVKQRYRLRHRERKVVTDRPLSPRSRRQRLPCLWIEVVAEPLKGELVDRSFQSQTGSTFAAPGADEFLAFAVVVRRRVVTLGGRGIILLSDTNHAIFYRSTDLLTLR